MQRFIIIVKFWVMTLHCSLIGGYNILEEYSPGLNFTLSSVKMDEAGSYKSLCNCERLCLRNKFNRYQSNFCLQCKSNDEIWSRHMVYSPEVNIVGSFPSWLQSNTHARAHIHTHIHTYITTANSITYVTFFNFTPPDKENNM
jgi:hypothetical protein